MRSICSSRCCADPAGGVGRSAQVGRGQHLASPCCAIAAGLWVWFLGTDLLNAHECPAQKRKLNYMPLMLPAGAGALIWMLVELPDGRQACKLPCTSERRSIRAGGAIAQLASMQAVGVGSFWYNSFPFHVCCVISPRSPVACSWMALFWPKCRAVIAGYDTGMTFVCLEEKGALPERHESLCRFRCAFRPGGTCVRAVTCCLVQRAWTGLQEVDCVSASGTVSSSA